MLGTRDLVGEKCHNSSSRDITLWCREGTVEKQIQIRYQDNCRCYSENKTKWWLRNWHPRIPLLWTEKLKLVNLLRAIMSAFNRERRKPTSKLIEKTWWTEQSPAEGWSQSGPCASSCLSQSQLFPFCASIHNHLSPDPTSVQTTASSQNEHSEPLSSHVLPSWMPFIPGAQGAEFYPFLLDWSWGVNPVWVISWILDCLVQTLLGIFFPWRLGVQNFLSDRLCQVGSQKQNWAFSWDAVSCNVLTLEL